MGNYPEIVERAAEAILEKQGRDAVILDMRGLVGYTDFFIVATGESVLQSRAIADEIMKELKDAGFSMRHIEGYEDGSWVLLDYGGMIVHIFMPETRAFYEVEKLWADAPARAVSED